MSEPVRVQQLFNAMATLQLKKESQRLRDLLRRMLDALEGRGSISHKEYVELKRQVREELKDE